MISANTLHIGICDDEPLAVDYLTRLLKKWAAQNSALQSGTAANGMELQISDFSSAEQFLFEYEANRNFDILLLDIQMGEMNGMELARKIREHNEKVQIIFITALSDYISDGYEVSALHYLIKPVSLEKLSFVMNRAIQNVQKAEPYLLLNDNQTSRRLPVNQILYAEVFAHYLSIHTQTETYELRENLSSFAEKLGGCFVRPHRSYLVNLRHIHSITKTEVRLDNGTVIPLSRYNYQKINQAFIEYYRGQLINGTV